jgi:hypothetical protein
MFWNRTSQYRAEASAEFVIRWYVPISQDPCQIWNGTEVEQQSAGLQVKQRVLPGLWDRLDDFELLARKFRGGSSVVQVISKIRLRQVEEMQRKIVLSWTYGRPG